jgi:hypothetical protein
MKSKRTIIVDGDSYIWTLEGNEVFSSNRWIIVTLCGTSCSRLYIDPYDHDFEIRPSTIALAIRSAREMGWDPENNNGELRVKHYEGKFKRLKSETDRA